jgi:chemotaxis protein MotB
MILKITAFKQVILISGFIVTFIVGIALSDIVLHTLNGIFDKEIFRTRIDMASELSESKDKLEETKEDLEAADRKYETYSGEMQQKQKELKNLIREIDSKIDPAVIKDALLRTPFSETGKMGKIFLKPGTGETILNPTTSDDPTVTEFKKTFNKKAKEIIDVSKGILGEKINRLNRETIRVNNELKDKNLELIRKLKEVEKYKKELDEHKKQVANLEGIKVDLEKTVGILETKIENGRLRVNFAGDILFTTGSHKLRKEGIELLESVYPILKKNVQNNDIFIAGHTDNVPIKAKTEKYESNWDLSTYRAIEVVKYLAGKGISPHYLTAAGYGEHKPIASNSTKAGKAKNRRVELFLIPKIIKRTE